MQALLRNVEVIGGLKTSLFNRGKPKSKPITKTDLLRWKNVSGSIVESGRWEAVIDGVAVVARIERV